jgi:acyl-CoA dehydrogenase
MFISQRVSNEECLAVSNRPSPDVAELVDRTRAFVREQVIPTEAFLRGNVHDGPDDVRDRLQQAARAAGVFAPQVPVAWGGLGLDHVGQTFVLEAAGYSLLGPLAMNCAAPDEGNMTLMHAVASDEQKERYLRPLARGEIRSCFAMTEPAPGAGSDPSLLATSATRLPGGRWRIDGRKWFITGAIGASLVICMARTSGAPGDRGGATLFLIDADTPGLRIVRNIDTLDESLFGGHAEIEFDGCEIEEAAVLGEIDRGFEFAQVRLAPARLTHCMRWLGIAQRSQDIAVTYAAQREAFGRRLGELGMVQQMIADTEIDLAAGRALVRETAAELDAGAPAGLHSSITKTFVAEAVWRSVDRAVQICGALGISGDVMLSRFLREVRPFRIYDGPSETHRWSIAQRTLKAHRVER